MVWKIRRLKLNYIKCLIYLEDEQTCLGGSCHAFRNEEQTSVAAVIFVLVVEQSSRFRTSISCCVLAHWTGGTLPTAGMKTWLSACFIWTNSTRVTPLSDTEEATQEKFNRCVRCGSFIISREVLKKVWWMAGAIVDFWGRNEESSCVCYIQHEHLNLQSTSKVRTFLGSEGILAGPHNVKCLFDGLNLV